MKVTLKQELNKELEVIIIYPRRDDFVDQIETYINMLSQVIPITHNNQTVTIPIRDICYIETVDRKVFVYTNDQIFQSNKKLFQLELELKNYGIRKVNKCCLVNVAKLKAIKNVHNSRLEAQLSNGEKIQVSRTYISNIRKGLLLVE